MSRNRILIVDDEPGLRFGIRDFLELQGYEIDEPKVAGKPRKFLEHRVPILSLPLHASRRHGSGPLPRLKRNQSRYSLLILTAHGSSDLAVRALRRAGAVSTSLELPALMVILKRLLEEPTEPTQTTRQPISPGAPCD